MSLVVELKEFATTLAHDAGMTLQRAYSQTTMQPSQRWLPKQLHLAEDATMDQWLVAQIQSHYPTHHILTEESGVHQSIVPVDDSPVIRWIIDPIDGSVNFSTHNPFVAISLAVEIDGVLTVGVIEAPLLGEQFVAVRGQGATVNGALLHVSSTAQLSQAYLVSCDGGVTDRTLVFSTLVRNYYDQVKDFRKLGSAALECAWVAAGRADAYITMAIDPWDVAAGILLVQEAGGQVTTLQGGAWTPTQTDLLCSNGPLHQAVLDRIW
jgi:myo-inositol-1(or 4)-monophosphatase